MTMLAIMTVIMREEAGEEKEVDEVEEELRGRSGRGTYLSAGTPSLTARQRGRRRGRRARRG